MKLVRGWWLPESDIHFARMMDKSPWVFRGERLIGVYQKNKLDRALRRTKKRRVACDIGAHIGFWSLWLADAFQHVIAFEPVAEHADCFARNVRQGNVTMHRCAVGSRCQLVGIALDAENSGKARVRGAGDVPMIALDDLDLDKVDLIKLDIEGGELAAIEGAAATIARCRPVVVVEQNDGTDAVDALLAMGMQVKERIGHDYLMTWRKA